MFPSAPKLLSSKFLAVVALAGIASAQSTYFQYFSQPGDYIGGGQSAILLPPTWTFSGTYSPTNGVEFSVTQSGGGGWWFLDFDTGTADPLHQGTYLYASRYPFNPAGTPGLSVYGNGAGCNTLWGHFVISQIEIGPGNQILRFAADFVQHCEGADPALFGTIRYQAAAPSLITRLVNYSDVPASYYYTSEPGDYIGQGLTELLDSDSYYFTESVGTGSAHVYVNGIHNSEWWYLDFSNGLNVPLAPGTYDGAVRWPFNPPGVPGLSVSGDGRGCNTLTGSFIVSEIEVGPLNLIQHLAVDFEQHCEGAPPALFGSVRVRSSAPPLVNRLLDLSFAEAFCFGDDCPCGNRSEVGGCRGSGREGATLTIGAGTNSLAAADLDVLATGLPPMQPALLLAASQTPGSVLGNGRLCVHATMSGLGVRVADSDGNAHWKPIGSSTLSSPGLVHMQAWYREATGPCGARSNTTNALQFSVAP
jgi:hypothetical protein